MDLNSTSFSGLPIHILSQVEQNLQEPVSRELHAFCHLCLPDAPAATELLRLSKEELLHLSQACKEAINQWCGCPRDYEAQPSGPSLTTRNSTLIAKTKSRDGCCIITRKDAKLCHGAHIFPYSLGKTQQKATLDIWKVLEMFWGPVRKDQLLQLIFGSRNTMSNPKTQINALYNMITLSPDAHSSWGFGLFTLEPLGAEENPYELRARFQWTPQKSESPKELGIASDPTSVELIPLTVSTRLFDVETALPIMDGHIVTFTTDDPIKAPVPHRDLLMLQCFLIRVLRMAGRSGGDMLETFDSDDEVSLLAASNAGSTKEETAHESTQLQLYHDRTTHLENSPLAPSSDPRMNIATPLEQPPHRKRWNINFSRKSSAEINIAPPSKQPSQKNRWRIFSRKSSPDLDINIGTPLEQEKRQRPFSINPRHFSYLRSVLACLHGKTQNRTARLSPQK